MIFDKLIEILKRIMPQIDTTGIKMDSNLTTDVGIDSLNLMLLAITVEDEFGVHFDSTQELKTVGDICKFVELNAGK